MTDQDCIRVLLGLRHVDVGDGRCEIKELGGRFPGGSGGVQQRD